MGELVQLRRHYEVIFVQALDLLRLQRDRGVSPAEADVGVVTFSFGEVANTLRKGKRLGEIFELEGPLDPQRPTETALAGWGGRIRTSAY